MRVTAARNTASQILPPHPAAQEPPEQRRDDVQKEMIGGSKVGGGDTYSSCQLRRRNREPCVERKTPESFRRPVHRRDAAQSSLITSRLLEHPMLEDGLETRHVHFIGKKSDTLSQIFLQRSDKTGRSRVDSGCNQLK
ncbi:hypothetical protein E2C01_071497 [Portunus trituberculatus]|uniref:Uncharacterized protein n=1 Tax=Portunus trituberculatus TaxID=210409 RepID=A0A5B7I4K7_PORTR|nr:hypothetical protein [Portunus trituberculatus]